MMTSPPAEIRPAGVALRDPEDFTSARKSIYDGVMEETKQAFPQSYGGVRLEAHDLQYEDPDDYDIDTQKQALLKRQFLGRRLRGTLRLYDEKTGDLLEEQRTTLMRVPHLTERGTFVHGGSEYTTLAQMRLMPGPYTRRKSNGETEVHFNVKRGTGSGFRIRFEPQTALYKLDIGQSQLRLYSLLHDLGVKDEELEKSWGRDVLTANKNAYDARVFEKAYQRLVKKPDPAATREQKVAALRQAFDGMQVNRRVAQKNLPRMFNDKQASDVAVRLPTAPNKPLPISLPTTDAPATSAMQVRLPPTRPAAQVATPKPGAPTKPLSISLPTTDESGLSPIQVNLPPPRAPEPPPAPQATPDRLQRVGFSPDELYRSIEVPETGSYKNPWVKSTKSTAYGPVQLTSLLARDYRRRFASIFNPNERKFLDAYGKGRGTWTAATPADRELYEATTKKIISHMYQVRAKSDLDRFIQLWRGVPESQDPNYYSAVRDGLPVKRASHMPEWMQSAFVKLARLGAIVFLPLGSGQYLLQRNGEDDRYPGKLRPPGGGKETSDKDFEDTIVRELNEEFGLPEEEVRDKIRYLGKDKRTEFKGTAIFELKDHGLEPGIYQASNDPEEQIVLEKATLDDPDYNGPHRYTLA